LRLFQKSQVIVRGIFFDGQKDKTLINTKDCGALHRRTVTEKHISLIKEPELFYLGHLTSTAGTAIEMKNFIINLIASTNINIEKLVAVGCDGTNVNTGRDGGIIKLY